MDIFEEIEKEEKQKPEQAKAPVEEVIDVQESKFGTKNNLLEFWSL